MYNMHVVLYILEGRLEVFEIFSLWELPEVCDQLHGRPSGTNQSMLKQAPTSFKAVFLSVERREVRE